MDLPIRSTRSTNVRKLQWSDEAAQALQELDKKDRLVLFTPVVPAYGSSVEVKKNDDEAQDPFESFGRALSQHHRNVNHVPFVPAAGLTEIHEEWIKVARVILTVNCEPSGLDAADVETSVAKQASFTSSVIEAVKDMQVRGDEHLLAYLYCGSRQPALLQDYALALQSSTYSAADLDKVAHALFGSLAA